MKQDFDRVERRALALRLTENELIEKHVKKMSYVTYWRAKTNRSSKKTAVKVLRRVESALDKLEKDEG